MFWQSSDSLLGAGKLCYLQESSPIASKRETSVVGSSGRRGWRPAGAGSLLDYLPTSALRSVREREGENQLLAGPA